MKISGYPVKFERRRYGTRTFTWVHVLIADTWYDIGDPFPAVTPKRVDLEKAVTEYLTLFRHGYFELVRICGPVIKYYRKDLFEHDREALLQTPKTPYVHIVKESQTQLYFFPPANHESWPANGERVRYLFGSADRYHILRQACECLEAQEREIRFSSGDVLVHYFEKPSNRPKLQRITIDDAIQIARRHRRDVLQTWNAPGEPYER